MVGGFDRLHPQLRHAIVNELGWRSLRPVQDLTIGAVLDGANSVVLAPTAGGKTEAALFPVLSRVLSEELPPVAALYVCPIRALLNNQEPRLTQLARMVGVEVFKWHGDVSANRKSAFLRRPVHLLMITPESLEVLLMGQGEEARRIFRGLSAVIIDEVHAFAGDDRGAHLVALLERLARFAGRDFQRIGLSATVGNPEEIGRWLQGSSERPFRLVDPPRPPPERELRIDYTPEEGDVARAVVAAGKGRKSLVFVESRRQAERLASSLAGRGVDVFVHHSAVSRADRALAEERFASGSNTAIVCTSTLELGIDVGDLDLVLQVNAPATVASLLQRMGRTGRRPGARANCSFFCETPESLLQTVALVRLMERGWVEPVVPSYRSAHVLAHQILALSIQERGLSRHVVADWVARASPFRELSGTEVQSLVDAMLASDVLTAADGRLLLGERGEKLYGGRNFFELYAVFSAPQSVVVQHQGAEVGTVQGFFLRSLPRDSGPISFRLANRAWKVIRIDWSRGVCEVEPAEVGRVPNWMGMAKFYSQTLCGEMKRTLADASVHPALTTIARAELEALRLAYDGMVGEGTSALESSVDGLSWHTFAGGAINRVLATALEQTTGRRWTSGNLSIRTRDPVGLAEASAAIGRWKSETLQGAEDAIVADDRGPTLTKFEPCLPSQMLRELRAKILADPAGAKEFMEQNRLREVATSH